MRILSFDTADEFCTLVLTQDKMRVDTRVVSAGREQAKVLAPLCQHILTENALKTGDIDRFAVCIGPGSFTGLRVGLAFARGLSLAAEKPLFGFDHFTCTLHALKRLGKIAAAPLLIVRDSKREELFVSRVEAGKEPGARRFATPDVIAGTLRAEPRLLLAGNAAPMLVEKFPELKARFLSLAPEEPAFSAALLALEGKVAPFAPPEPVYMRDADVTFPKSAKT